MGDFTQKMNLATWDQLLDRYDYEQLTNNWQKIDFHDHSPGRGVQIAAGGIANGAINSYHLSASLASNLGINASGISGRGSIYNAGPGTRSNTTYGNLSDTPDQVTVSLATNGLIMVSYHALWTMSSGGTAFVEMVANGAPVNIGNGTNSGGALLFTTSTANFLSPVYTAGGQLTTVASTSSNAVDFATTGGVEGMGGAVLPLFANAGTYTIGLYYGTGNNTQTVTVQNRRLAVWAVNFQ